MQIVMAEEDEKGLHWYIHNDQNGHEYKFSICDGKVELSSSSNLSEPKTGRNAIFLLDELTTSFSKVFSDFYAIPKLNKAIEIANEVLGILI